MRFAFIACSRSKLDRAAPASEIYTGDLFRRSLAYARAAGLTPWVLSAKHGLLAIDRVIEPYDEALIRMAKTERTTWGTRVRSAAAAIVPPYASITLLAGALYREPFEAELWTGFWERRLLDVPMRGLGIGQQRAWLARETARLTAERGAA